MRSSLADMVVAVDAGGTNTRIALVSGLRSASTSINVEDIATFRTEQEYDSQIKRVADEIRAARALANERGGMASGVGVSLGGRMLRDGSGLEVAPNLPEYAGKPFVANLTSRAGLRVRAAHDTVCGLLGERRYGALAGAERCAYLTVSTGLGAAIYLAGPGGASGAHVSIEMGHQILDGATRPCLCGQIGCLETYVGGRQLELRHGAALQALSDPGVWDMLVEKLALGLVNLAQLTRVELVAVGGAIALARGSLLGELQAHVNARLRNLTLHIVPAAFGERAPLIGAAALLDVEPGAILS